MRTASILIVDDEVVFTKHLSMLLTKRGYEVAAVHDGESAIEAIMDREFDVVLLDLKMPGMDGLDTLKIIKQKKPILEVIILTGHGSVDTAIEGVDYGAFDYAMKPFVIEDLTERIRQAFERKLLHEKRTSHIK